MDLSQYVNVFSGTTNGGNNFPGVTAEPFALVKLGPDFKYATAEAYAGYLPDAEARLTGFSMMHVTGIGGAPKYGVVSQMPTLGTVPDPLTDLSVKRATGDHGSVGYFKSSLENGIVVELAATAHAGLLQYGFPPGQGGSIVVDVSHVLPSFRPFGWGQRFQGGSISVAANGYYGSGTYSNGWNLAPDWTIYFCGRFDRIAASSKTFVTQGATVLEYGQSPTVTSKDRLGAIFSFDDSQVTSRVGISFISVERACEHLEREIPAGKQLVTLVNDSKAKWNAEVFGKITTSDTNPDNLALLYTSLYGMHILPSNRTGESKWQSNEPYYDDIYTYWDLFRCTTSLFHITNPTAYEETLRSTIDVWRHEGWLPDGRSSNFNGRTQGGSNADNVLADAYVKGMRGQINWEDGYAAMLTDAESVPPPNNDAIAPDSSTQQGRGALPDWLSLGWITPRFTRAVTRAVEYAGNDFALRQVAAGLGKLDDAAKYLQRSRQWRNHWNPAATALGVTGFLVPRNADGSFVAQDPLSCGGCYWGDAYYQGKPFEYTMNAHHDIAKLVELGGGNDAFVRRLDTLMDPINNIFNPGNQPSFTSPYLYNFVNRQDLSVSQSRRVAKSFYNAGPAGLPGAGDAGSMNSWLLWNMIGLYPITGQTTFLVGSPWFESLTIATPSGRNLTIRTIGGNSGTSFYVQSLKVNGRQWNKNWLTWEDVFANGGIMEFVLGSQPPATNWDSGDLPPSPASSSQGAVGVGGAKRWDSVGETEYSEQVRNPNETRAAIRLIAIIIPSLLGSVLLISVVLAASWYFRKRPFDAPEAEKLYRTSENTRDTSVSEISMKFEVDKPEREGVKQWWKL